MYKIDFLGKIDRFSPYFLGKSDRGRLNMDDLSNLSSNIQYLLYARVAQWVYARLISEHPPRYTPTNAGSTPAPGAT